VGRGGGVHAATSVMLNQICLNYSLWKYVKKILWTSGDGGADTDFISPATVGCHIFVTHVPNNNNKTRKKTYCI